VGTYDDHRNQARGALASFLLHAFEKHRVQVIHAPAGADRVGRSLPIEVELLIILRPAGGNVSEPHTRDTAHASARRPRTPVPSVSPSFKSCTYIPSL
jgi:hypothetical protein